MRMIRNMEESGMKMNLIENSESLDNHKSIRVTFVPWSDKNE